ncbi:MAG: AraC family transcriptional regulator [Eubacteriales bacterium]|nr:AraC family transcriptional regulator [Eubacteriales bacterium]
MICRYAPTFMRKVVDGGIVPLVGGEIHASRTLPLHVLLYIISGEWDLRQQDEYFQLRKDDAILMHSGLHHEGVHGAAPNTRVMWIHFTTGEGDAVGAGDNPTAICVETLTHCASNPRIRQLMEHIIELKNKDQRRDFIKESAVLHELLCEMSETQNGSFHPYRNFARDVSNFFIDHKNRFYSGKQLEDIFGLDIKTINKRFKAECGESIYRFQLRFHLQGVYNYLEICPNIRMSELAEMFGFCDEYHMSRVFKKEYGITPAQRRNELLKR